jgi:hypothetical protein
MGTKNNPGKYDCYVKAGPDEPIFVLRAKDALADELVDKWADEAALFLGDDHPKVKEARACAQAMRDYPGRRYPNDEPIEL